MDTKDLFNKLLRQLLIRVLIAVSYIPAACFFLLRPQGPREISASYLSVKRKEVFECNVIVCFTCSVQRSKCHRHLLGTESPSAPENRTLPRPHTCEITSWIGIIEPSFAFHLISAIKLVFGNAYIALLQRVLQLTGTLLCHRALV